MCAVNYSDYSLRLVSDKESAVKLKAPVSYGLYCFEMSYIIRVGINEEKDLASLNSWIWDCSNMVNTLELADSFFLAFLGDWRTTARRDHYTFPELKHMIRIFLIHIPVNKTEHMWILYRPKLVWLLLRFYFVSHRLILFFRLFWGSVFSLHTFVFNGWHSALQ